MCSISKALGLILSSAKKKNEQMEKNIKTLQIHGTYKNVYLILICRLNVLKIEDKRFLKLTLRLFYVEKTFYYSNNFHVFS